MYLAGKGCWDDMHRPVLLREAIEFLNVQPDGIYIDATLGAGGTRAGGFEAAGKWQASGAGPRSKGPGDCRREAGRLGREADDAARQLCGNRRVARGQRVAAREWSFGRPWPEFDAS